MNKDEKTKLAGAYCKLILAGLGQPVDVADIDAITYVKMHRFAMRVKKEDGTVVDAVTHEQMHEILKLIEDGPDPIEKEVIKEVAPIETEVITVGDEVEVEYKEELHKGEVKAIGYQVTGLGNKFHNINDVKKV